MAPLEQAMRRVTEGKFAGARAFRGQPGFLDAVDNVERLTRISAGRVTGR